MKTRVFVIVASVLAILVAVPGSYALAAKPIVLGCPLSTAFLYGWDAERGITLAVEEINAAGGVDVAGEKRPFKVEVIDTRDLEPGVPVSEALMAVEKLILEKKADFLVGGPVRSEAALAAMDLLSKYKRVSILTTGVLTPKYHARVAKEYDKFKYCFRITGEAKWMVVGEIIPCLVDIGQRFGVDRLFIMIQDVAHARAGGGIIAKVMAKKGGMSLASRRSIPRAARTFPWAS